MRAFKDGILPGVKRARSGQVTRQQSFAVPLHATPH